MQRRRFLTGATAVGALLAGCTSSGEDDGDAPAGNDTTADAGGTNAATPTSASGTTEESTDGPPTSDTTTETDATTDAENGSYAVSMPPVGEVTFDAVPETWVANNGSWADMGIALGRDPPKAVWLTERYHTRYYEAIDGVSVDKSDMVSLYSDGVSKELFYELDGDVHVMDPNFLTNRYKGWERSDIEEITEQIAPLFGNSVFSTGYPWHESYPYLSLYEAFERLAAVFDERDRYEAFAALHEEFLSAVDEVVPAGEKPAVAIMWASGDEPESFSPYLIGDGTSFKQWRDLEVRDALAETDVRDFHADRGAVDYETLLEVDPDVLLLRGQEAKSASAFQDTLVAFMNDHSVASNLSAVESGDVYRGGPLYQGPITNLVLTERAAGQIYGVDEKLFDRGRVADIVNGEL